MLTTTQTGLYDNTNRAYLKRQHKQGWTFRSALHPAADTEILLFASKDNINRENLSVFFIFMRLLLLHSTEFSDHKNSKDNFILMKRQHKQG